MAKKRDKKALIRALARQRGLDPSAVLAVANVEGGFQGAVGDQGTSFGPFQLHKGGALPQVANPQAWANSPQGIAYALNQIAKVARGKHGRDAISAIVSQFERPAAPGAEIQKAFGRYGAYSGGANPLRRGTEPRFPRRCGCVSPQWKASGPDARDRER